MPTRIRIAITIIASVAAAVIVVSMAIGGYRIATRPPVVITIPAQMSAASPLPYAPAQIASHPQPAATPPTPATPMSGTVYVHVAGAVEHAGVYQLAAGSRVFEAVHAAGAALPTADSNAVDLAEAVRDGEKVYIPIKGESASADPDETGSTNKLLGNAALPPSEPAHPAKRSRGRSGGRADKLTDPSQGTVDINTAGGDELQRLPGVGPAMSQRILTERAQIGRYRKPDDLLNVTGIGPKKFAKMARFVRV